MFPIRWQSGCRMAMAATSVLCLLSACGPARPAFFQPQARSYPRPVAADSPPFIIVETADSTRPLQTRSIPANSQPAPVVTLVQIAVRPYPPNSDASPHINPDSYPVQRLNRRTSLSVTDHVAPRSHLIDRHSPARKTHKVALLALGIAVLSYGSLLLTAGGTLLWVLSLTMPLVATMLGTSSLMTINRHKDRYRGKGWAMAAIVIGTGALGLALMAVAALSVSKMVWE